MRKGDVMSFALLLALLSIDGTVINKTTGQPVAGSTVTLIKAGAQGMQPAGSATTDAAGKFTLEGSTEGISLLQAVYENVNYNKLLEPGASTTGVEIAVFSTSKNVKSATASQHMILIEPVPNSASARPSSTTTPPRLRSPTRRTAASVSSCRPCPKAKPRSTPPAAPAACP